VRVKLALAVGLLAIALAAGATLARAPLVVDAENFPGTHHSLIATAQAAEACQAREVLPIGTTAIRLSLTAVLGPKVTVSVLSGARVLARGVHAPGWEGASVTVAVRPLPATVAPVEICVRLREVNGRVTMLGRPTEESEAAHGRGQALPGRMHVEFLRDSRTSWWSMATAIAQRLGLGRAASGTWNAFLVMGLAAMLVVLSCWLLTRELR
jgi:hypothetical protein